MDINRWRHLIGEEDFAAYSKGSFGRRMGFGSHPAILVVDMTYAFVDPAYPTAFGNRGAQALEGFSRLLPAARERSLPIVYSRRNDRRQRWQRGVLDLKWGLTEDPAWLYDPRADQWPPEIAPQQGDAIIEKGKPSCFWETPLRSILTFLGTDTLIIGGISTSGCVRAAVTDAFSSNYRVIVPEECCADRSQFAHMANLLDMDMKFADVVRLEEVLAHLQQTAIPSSVVG